MIESILLGIGGVGLFLLGMVILTDGLKALAGNSLRRLLVRFTRTPARGAVTGALATAVLQSSSVTTITAVGFVGAGLMTFSQGLGIIFGANIGTTITGWMVALFGFKLPVGTVALPLLPVGVLLRLFGPQRLAQAGWALAGFCLIFIGLDAMQDGLGYFQDTLTPDFFPPDTLWGRIQLVLIGIVFTLITQSSSAGVAMALVAINAGAMELAQAAAMVIGMDIGTTFKTALATIGASTATRRTGWAHVIYNLMTGVLAFLLLTPFLTLSSLWMSGAGAVDAELTLVAFHTFFNVMGVVLVLPFAAAFAHVMEQLIPERGGDLTRRLDESLLSDPSSAVDAAAATADEIAHRLIETLMIALRPRGRQEKIDIEAFAAAIGSTRYFLERIQTGPGHPETYRRHQHVIHALDHLWRLARRLDEQARIDELKTEHRLRRWAAVLHGSCEREIAEPESPLNEARFNRLRRILREERDRYRARTIAATARREINADTGLARMDAARWLHRVTYHLWRIVHHLDAAIETRPTPADSDAGAPQNDARQPT